MTWVPSLPSISGTYEAGLVPLFNNNNNNDKKKTGGTKEVLYPGIPCFPGDAQVAYSWQGLSPQHSLLNISGPKSRP